MKKWSLKRGVPVSGKGFNGPHKRAPIVAFSLRLIHKLPIKTDLFGVTVNGCQWPLGGFVLLSLLLNDTRNDPLLGNQWTNDRAS